MKKLLKPLTSILVLQVCTASGYRKDSRSLHQQPGRNEKKNIQIPLWISRPFRPAVKSVSESNNVVRPTTQKQFLCLICRSWLHPEGNTNNLYTTFNMEWSTRLVNAEPEESPE